MKKSQNVFERKGKHLSLEERIEIQSGLDSGKTARQIAECIQRTPSTVTREIRKHTKTYTPSQNCCTKHYCTKNNVCHNMQCTKMCKTCIKCAAFCEEYEEYICPRKSRHPLNLCNGCNKVGYCRLKKSKYEAKNAEMLYQSELKSKREGFDLTDKQLEQIDMSVTPLVKQGLSPYVIKQTLGNELPISEATLRRLIDAQKLNARRIDLRDAVKRKPRKKDRTMKDEIVSPNKEGHLYSDYLAFLTQNPDTMVVQMDCVEGIKTDSKTLLTLHFPNFHFQLAFLMPDHTNKSVVKTLDDIETKLGAELYTLIFGVILTDNGHEFTDIVNMERSVFGGKRTNIFFCEPNRSEEKAECETNHKFIRYILPKKTSFEDLTQEKVTLMMNHINNTARKSLIGRTPFQLVKTFFPPKFLSDLGIMFVPSKSLCLKPELLKR